MWWRYINCLNKQCTILIDLNIWLHVNYKLHYCCFIKMYEGIVQTVATQTTTNTDPREIVL